MEKIRIGLLISTVLIVVLATSNVWFYMVKQNQIVSLNDEKSGLQEQIKSLNDLVDSLQTYTTDLQNQVNTLNDTKNSLQSQVNELQSDRTNLRNQVSDLNAKIGNLQIALQNPISQQNFLNSYNYNRTANPVPFYEQFFNMILVDNSSNFLGSLAGNLRLSRLPENQVRILSVLSFLGRRDGEFDIGSLNVTLYFYGPLPKGGNEPPPPFEPETLRIQTVDNGECITSFEGTISGSDASDEVYFHMYIVSNSHEGNKSMPYDAVVIRSSDGRVWKSESTLELHLFGISFRSLSELEGKTEAETFVVGVH